VYFLGGAGRGLFGKQLALRLLGPPGPVSTCGPPACCGSVEEDLRPALVRLYPGPDEALAALEQVIDGAACRIDVMMFMWDQGPLGRSLAERLAARAGPGLRVRVLVDGGGNLMFGLPKEASADEVNRAVCWLARQPYVEVIRTRNPLAHFDHRKLVVADGRVAWTGGRNFTGQAFSGRHDLSFTVEGPLVHEMDERFERCWQDQGGRPGAALPAVPAPGVNAWARLTETTPVEHDLKRTLYEVIDGACHHVWLKNPYLADGGLIAKLARARRRGVDARVVLTVGSDTKAVNRANRVTVNLLLAAGVRVYLHPGPLHAKAAVIDGCRAYLGTGNFDTLSLRRNYELGLLVAGGPLLAEVEERVFGPDLRPDWEVREPFPVSAPEYLDELLAGLFM
jgi:cardiolipin synthase